MTEMRFKRNVIAHDEHGHRYALKEYVKLIDATTMHSKTREIVEGAKKWYLGDDGLIAGSDPHSPDGSLEVQGSSMRLWLDPEYA